MSDDSKSKLEKSAEPSADAGVPSSSENDLSTVSAPGSNSDAGVSVPGRNAVVDAPTRPAEASGTSNARPAQDSSLGAGATDPQVSKATAIPGRPEISSPSLDQSSVLDPNPALDPSPALNPSPAHNPSPPLNPSHPEHASTARNAGGKWNPDQYSKFLDERTRPAAELLRRVHLSEVESAVDLGCGPGNSTELLWERWPNADVSGVDNSQEMLDKAKQKYPAMKFVLSDIAKFKSEQLFDLIFSNAAYQWVPDHDTLLPALCKQLKPGGVLAFQVPHNHERRTHQSMREVAAEHKWSVDLSTVRNTPPVLSAQRYYDILCPSMYEIDIWETEYFHPLASVNEVVEWLKGTGLKPFLAPLTADEQAKFLDLYKQKLETFIKPQADGKVLLPFPRLFVVARRRAD